MSNYSIDICKKFIFVDELDSVINDPLSEGIYGEENIKVIRDYLKRRIDEIMKEHG